MYRYFRALSDANIFWRLNTATDTVQHVVIGLSNVWADPWRSVVHGMAQMQAAIDRNEVVEINYNPLNTDESESTNNIY